MRHYLHGNADKTPCGLTGEFISQSQHSGTPAHWTADPSHVNCPGCLASIDGPDPKPTGTKRDRNKTRYDLIPHEFEESLARVLTFGAQAYGPNNWRMMEDLGRFEAAYRRHWIAYKNGEFYDPETGQPHLVHAICNLMFICEIKRAIEVKKTQ